MPRPGPLVWRASEGLEGLAAVPVGGGGAWLGGAGGPGCGARGRWRGLAGLRGDAPSEARSADDSRAGRRPRAHHAARPGRAPGTPVGPQAARHMQPGPHTKQPDPMRQATRRPEHPWDPKQRGPHTARGPKRRSASGPHTHACQLLTG